MSKLTKFAPIRKVQLIFNYDFYYSLTLPLSWQEARILTGQPRSLALHSQQERDQ